MINFETGQKKRRQGSKSSPDPCRAVVRCYLLPKSPPVKLVAFLLAMVLRITEPKLSVVSFTQYYSPVPVVNSPYFPASRISRESAW